MHIRKENKSIGIMLNSVEEFRERLLYWYSVNGRRFYWRNRSISNYKKIIAEVLLQRTKAETVAEFYRKFLEKYPNWKSIANKDIKILEETLKPIGLYRQRAKRLYSLSKVMLMKGGRIPINYNELIMIPMVGQYIANSIMSVVYDKPFPMLDVNMARVIERCFGPRKLKDIRYDPYLQDLAYKIVNSKESKKINWAILDFAALVCKSRKPECQICSFNLKCNFYSINVIV